MNEPVPSRRDQVPPVRTGRGPVPPVPAGPEPVPPVVARLTLSGLLVESGLAELGAARAKFDKGGWVALPGLVGPPLLARLQGQLSVADFEPRVHGEAGRLGGELCLRPGALATLLALMVNDPAVFALVGALTGCPPIGSFDGRVYRLVPGAGHRDEWHDDVGEGRLVGMTLHLSNGPFQGGILQLRRAGETAPLTAVEPMTPGDAALFRIDPAMQHRVSEVEGPSARTVYAGWYRASPDYRQIFPFARPGLRRTS